jgi:hypothetical protein
MDSMMAFARANVARQRGAKQKVFDWIKAAQLIRERQSETASAGLSQDWEYTGGSIFANGQPVPREETYTYLSSNWAIPELNLDGEVISCWKFEDDTPGWNAGTYWPPEALEELKGEPIRN